MSTTLKVELCVMLAVAVEIAAAKWVVASSGGGAGRIRRKVLSQETAVARFEALVLEVVEARRRLGVGEGARVVVAYEAGQEGFWLVRALRDRGIEAEVIDPVSLQVDRRRRRAKTDRLDAEALVQGLLRWMGGDDRALRMVRVASVDDEDNREWQRERDRLMGEQRGCVDRIVKKLRTQGVWIALDQNVRQRLRDGTLCRFDGQPLAPMLQAALVIELDRAEAAQAKLKQIERKQAELSPPALERIDRLTQLRGIGPVGARQLALRLFWRSFGNRRQVGSCTGLVGMPYDSGTMRKDQGISKAGDPRLRAVLIELGWMWLRHQPDSAIAQWFAKRTQGQSKRGKRGKRIMIVAVARRLVIALWRYLAYGEVPQGAKFKQATAAA
jgi:transposase